MADPLAPAHLTWDGREGTAEEEALGGSRPYSEVLADLHRLLKPRRYLEIGIRHGMSLSLASCESIGVDPDPDVKVPLGANTTVTQATSDDFFAGYKLEAGTPFDLIFIDGMHLFEYVVRDFINAEKLAGPGSVIVLDDTHPNHPAQARRRRQSRVWTGDVWKIVPTLRKWRPELRVVELDTHPTGLLLVTGLDPDNRVLEDNLDAVLGGFGPDEAPPEATLKRSANWPPGPELLAGLTEVPRARPKLSVVVISYNMPRELPRTIRSLSPSMQQGMSSGEYEVILIDNGSKTPPDSEALRRLLPGLIVHSVKDSYKSPCRAINLGLRMAQGNLVGVMIDGARIASPGLLEGALTASRLSPRSAVGTVAFHLGPEVQMDSILHGYNQKVEDRLLAESRWESNGYRLLDISVLAGSSSGGWFALPNETNALFMPRDLWQEIGGFDERFESAGGGLANLDVWKRVCEDPTIQVVMLLGEATFHQVHGGIATNSRDHEAAVAGFSQEYKAIRGKVFTPPVAQPLFCGKMPPEALPSLAASFAERPPAPVRSEVKGLARFLKRGVGS